MARSVHRAEQDDVVRVARSMGALERILGSAERDELLLEHGAASAPILLLGQCVDRRACSGR